MPVKTRYIHYQCPGELGGLLQVRTPHLMAVNDDGKSTYYGPVVRFRRVLDLNTLVYTHCKDMGHSSG